jgi:hypothetical protein
LPFGWFRDQLARRLENLAEVWIAKLGSEHMAVRHVKNFMEQIRPQVIV